MSALGVRLDPVPQISISDSIGLARLAEERGYGSVWVPEGWGVDSLTRLAAFAVSTQNVRLATGILPVFARTPALVAMSAAGMDLVSGRRFTLGLGVGHRGSVEGGHGVPFRNPVTRVRETVEIVRRFLRGEPVSHQGKVFSVNSGSLGYDREFSVPIYLAALGPRMVELAGEVADGVLLNWAAPAYVETALESLRRGARRAGRDPGEIDVACYVRVAVTDDPERVKAPLDRQILRYAGMEYYRNFFASTGFEEEMRAVSRYLAEGDEAKAAASVSEEMRRQLAVFGDPEFCCQEIDKRRGLGIRTPVVAPFAAGDALDSYRSAIEAFSS